LVGDQCWHLVAPGPTATATQPIKKIFFRFYYIT
jgi:hypothetical protein